MCTSNIYYPLVHLFHENKNKVLFNLPVKIEKSIDIYKFTYAYVLKNQELFSNHNERFVKFVKIPCGRCNECLNARARDWVSRLLFEAKQRDFKDCWFLTLTYDNDHLPERNNLCKEHLSAFNKKLRTYLTRSGLSSNFKFYSVGEYGDTTFRPHYHGIYFGLPISDLVLYTYKDFKPLYTSKFISDIWNKGFITIGAVEASSCAYVARYCDKKQIQTPEEKSFLKSVGVEPEFALMSRRPGIGLNYDFINDISNNRDSFFINGVKYNYSTSILKRLLTKYKDNNLAKEYNILYNYIEQSSKDYIVNLNNSVIAAERVVGSMSEYVARCVKSLRKKGVM